jgi:hypothetical protein
LPPRLSRPVIATRPIDGPTRRSRTGVLEIVYDDGVAKRLVWRVAGGTDPLPLGEALKAALDANRVLPALYSELKKRSIAIEVVARP